MRMVDEGATRTALMFTLANLLASFAAAAVGLVVLAG
jgi:hypothetical protein